MDEEFNKMMREEHGAMTHFEAREWAGKLECEMCVRFDLEISECTKGKRPRKVLLLDGPNESMHVNKSCELFKRCVETDFDSSGLAMSLAT